MKPEQLQLLLDSLPTLPGVYLMKNHTGKVVYVGKAKNLRVRVRQYFSESTSDTRYFLTGLAARLSTIETVVTSSEKEAILLEYNLIQRYLPRYNIRLMDDKDFLCIRLDITATWPRIEVVRRPRKDKALYFGPYPSAKGARETVRLIHRYFKLRNCNDKMFNNRVRPCLQHQIKRCFGPCVLDVDAEEYRRQVSFVRMFLEGRRDDLLSSLKQRMADAAAEFDFEAAAILRDQVRAVEETLAPQRITEISDLDRDVVGMYRDGDLVQVAIMEISAGRMSGMRDFFFKGQEFPDEELLSSFVVQQYMNPARFPDEVLVSRELNDADVLSEILSDARGAKVRVYTPKRGGRVDQLKLADRNAEQLFESRRRTRENMDERLRAVQEKLHLPRLPVRIECVDIAHFAGTNTVGAISAVIEGSVDRAKGRTFRVRTVDGGNDYEAIREVLTRRFTRAKNSDEGWDAPDLLVIDGGRGQLGIALAVLKELELVDQPVVGLAKERSEQANAETDRVFLPGRLNPISVRAETSPLFVLSVARDEAHRLANSFQAKSRQKKSLGSELDAIPGVGPKTRKLLLKHLGSLKRVREASVEDLTTVPGFGEKLATKVYAALHPETSDGSVGSD